MKLFSKRASEPLATVPSQAEKHVTPSQIEQGPLSTSIDPAIEKRVRRKLDLNLVPLVSALYLRQSNISPFYIVTL